MQDRFTKQYVAFLERAKIESLSFDVPYAIDSPIELYHSFDTTKLPKAYVDKLFQEVYRFEPIFENDSYKTIYDIVAFYEKLADLLQTDYDDSTWFDFESLYIALLYKNVDEIKEELESRYHGLSDEKEDEWFDWFVPASEGDEFYESDRFEKVIDDDVLGLNDFYEEEAKYNEDLPDDLRDKSEE